MIKIYKLADYTKSGKLKKRAIPFYQSDKKDDEFKKETAKEIISLGLTCFSSPYFFSHINAIGKDMKPVYIHESVKIGMTELMTTPQTLFSALKNLEK